jgi:DNA repair photolyase
MFPSSHDITPLNITESIMVLRKLLSAGNEMLIVSKPHLTCVKAMCTELADYKGLILFRFTIGSADNKVLKFWDPAAPRYRERISALKWAYDHGFETSVSCEPMLDDNIHHVIRDVRSYTTDSIWLGKANRLRSCLAQSCEGELLSKARQKANELLATQTDSKIHLLYNRYKDDEIIRWKDSIKKVVGIQRPTARGLDI